MSDYANVFICPDLILVKILSEVPWCLQPAGYHREVLCICQNDRLDGDVRYPDYHRSKRCANKDQSDF